MNVYQHYTDQELTGLLKSGDHSAFSEIYSRYMGILYVHALKMLRDADEAEDVVAELFTSLWEKAADLNFNNTLSAYLYRAVKNKVFNILAHRKIKEAYFESLQTYIDGGEWNTTELYRAKELAKIIENEVAKMPSKMREVFEMSRNLNLSHKEIAAELGISDKTVKKQINNAIKMLRLKVNLFVTLMVL